MFYAGITPDTRFPVNFFSIRKVIGMYFYLQFRVMIKNRYDELSKLDYVSKERLKSDINNSNDKLVMLMPKFVLDRINYSEMSSKFKVTS